MSFDAVKHVPAELGQARRVGGSIVATMDCRDIELSCASTAAIEVPQGHTTGVARSGAVIVALQALALGSVRVDHLLRRVTGLGGRSVRRVGLICLACVVAVAGACGGWAAWLRVSGNTYEIEAGVYRSAQPTPVKLLSFVRDHNVKTVLNLRGDHSGEEWYEAEANAAKQGGAQLISIRLSADNEPDDATLARLLETLRTADRPLLIHCNGGADRAGLASALYELTVAHRPAALAARQLSFRYGHFPWLTSRTGAMDRVFQRVAGGAP